MATLLGLAGSPSSTRAAAAEQGPDPSHNDEQVRPFLTKHCQGCHGGEKPRGNFRTDRLSADFADKWGPYLRTKERGFNHEA